MITVAVIVVIVKSGEPGELDESGKLDEYGEPGSKEKKKLTGGGD